jgi:type I restriction enzyme M protein
MSETLANKFLQKKQEFDKKYFGQIDVIALIPVHLTINKKCVIKDKVKKQNEEYYKWQFFYALINSGLYKKDYIGAEISFPKGNENSAPIKMDGAIFDDPKWFDWYKKFHESKNQSALDWLRKHLIAVIEFKKENSKNTETVYNQQLKPAMKESESDYCLGIIYDTERLYLFQKKNNLYLRLDESFNLKGDKSTIKDLSLHLTDSYYKIPSFEQIEKRSVSITIDRSKRTVDDLDIVTGVFSNQINDSISDILKTLDKVSLLNQRGYEILIQMIALKIFDEKKNEWLKYYIQDAEHKDLKRLKFYIEPDERNYSTLNDKNLQIFIKRIQDLKKQAQTTYREILNESIIDLKNEAHVAIVGSIVHNLQDYSFTKSSKNDLYQLIFYRFANAFTKSEKGQFLTPIPIIDFLVSIVNPRKPDSIIDPTSGSGDFLSMSYVNSDSKIDDNNIYGVDNDYQMVTLAQLNMLLNGDGNAKIKFQSGSGSITHKFDSEGKLVSLIPEMHKKGNWDNWSDHTEIKRFSVVLTNPPFGEDRKIEPKTQKEKEILEMYELWDIAKSGKWIDPGLIFLENAYRILDENGRLGIILSNSLASIDRWEKARQWILSNMRIVALFDLPANVFADTGVNTTLIVAYKPSKKELKKLQENNYDIFIKNITKVGYEVRTSKRVKYFNPIYKINENTFEIEQGEDGSPLLDEEFTTTIGEFKDWCLSQEKTLQELFLGK